MIKIAKTHLPRISEQNREGNQEREWFPIAILSGRGDDFVETVAEVQCALAERLGTNARIGFASEFRERAGQEVMMRYVLPFSRSEGVSFELLLRKIGQDIAITSQNNVCATARIILYHCRNIIEAWLTVSGLVVIGLLANSAFRAVYHKGVEFNSAYLFLFGALRAVTYFRTRSGYSGVGFLFADWRFSPSERLAMIDATVDKMRFDVIAALAQCRR